MDVRHRRNPASNYMFKVSNWNTRTTCETCSKLTIKIPERRHWHRSGIFFVTFEHISHYMVNCEHISHLVLVFQLLTLSKEMPAGKYSAPKDIYTLQKQSSRGVQGVLKICSKFTEHPYWSVISIKLQSNFIQITLWQWCSPVNLLHIFRTSFLTNTYRGLLLNLSSQEWTNHILHVIH